jgi:sacsin
MSNLLDDLDVRPVDYTPVDNSWAPSPGTPVPRECLQFLVQELVQFSSGDYAVFEVFDNLHDDDKDEQGKAAVYIYVKIVHCLSTDQDQFPLYKVNIGDGQTMDVRSLRLYVIVRPRSTDGGSTAGNPLETCLYTGEKRVYTEKDKAAIFQEIEEALVDAWHINFDDFRRVYKRLLLRWHPDKNQNSKLCTEITKHIINFAKRLQSGNIDSTKIPSYKERYGDRHNGERYSRQWDDYVYKANNTSGNASQHGAYPTFDPEEFAERVRRETRYASGSNWQDDNRPTPQPEMAKVWLTQAKNDLTAAKSLMTVATSESYNWVCATSQQVWGFFLPIT